MPLSPENASVLRVLTEHLYSNGATPAILKAVRREWHEELNVSVGVIVGHTAYVKYEETLAADDFKGVSEVPKGKLCQAGAAARYAESDDEAIGAVEKFSLDYDLPFPTAAAAVHQYNVNLSRKEGGMCSLGEALRSPLAAALTKHGFKIPGPELLPSPPVVSLAKELPTAPVVKGPKEEPLEKDAGGRLMAHSVSQLPRELFAAVVTELEIAISRNSPRVELKAAADKVLFPSKYRMTIRAGAEGTIMIAATEALGRSGLLGRVSIRDLLSAGLSGTFDQFGDAEPRVREAWHDYGATVADCRDAEDRLDAIKSKRPAGPRKRLATSAPAGERMGAWANYSDDEVKHASHSVEYGFIAERRPVQWWSSANIMYFSSRNAANEGSTPIRLGARPGNMTAVEFDESIKDAHAASCSALGVNAYFGDAVDYLKRADVRGNVDVYSIDLDTWLRRGPGAMVAEIEVRRTAFLHMQLQGRREQGFELDVLLTQAGRATEMRKSAAWFNPDRLRNSELARALANGYAQADEVVEKHVEASAAAARKELDDPLGQRAHALLRYVMTAITPKVTPLVDRWRKYPGPEELDPKIKAYLLATTVFEPLDTYFKNKFASATEVNLAIWRSSLFEMIDTYVASRPLIVSAQKWKYVSASSCPMVSVTLQLEPPLDMHKRFYRLSEWITKCVEAVVTYPDATIRYDIQTTSMVSARSGGLRSSQKLALVCFANEKRVASIPIEALNELIDEWAEWKGSFLMDDELAHIPVGRVELTMPNRRK